MMMITIGMADKRGTLCVVLICLTRKYLHFSRTYVSGPILKVLRILTHCLHVMILSFSF